MLVLVNGISGNIGHAVGQALLRRGHQVRGLGRSPENIDPALKDRLESFVQAANWYDCAAHDRAFAGVDAFVNAAASHGFLLLDHALLLLRAAERAGVKIFVASAWNYDWTKTPLGYMESYDPLIMFKQQAELTSTIKPIFVFTGVLAEFWFGVPARGWFGNPEVPAWNPKQGTALYFGDGKTRHQFTTFRDAAEYTTDLLLRPEADQGGCFQVMSFGADVWQMQATYRKVTGQEVALQCAGSIEEMRGMALGARAAGQKNEYQKYVGFVDSSHARFLAHGRPGFCIFSLLWRGNGY